MTELAQTIETPSTVLGPDDGTDASGGGTPRSIPDAEPDKADAKPEKLSLRDTIAAAVKDDAKETDAAKPDKDADEAKGKAESEKGAQKPQEGKEGADKADAAKDAEKGAQRGPDGKFAGKQAEGDDAKPADAQKSEDQAPKAGHIEPPKNFLPDAKETWRNTPRAVQRDVENTIKTYEEKVATLQEHAQRYEPIREYDELVRQNGRAGLHETLAEVKQLEDMMERNPIAALNQVLLRAGPRKADGQPVSLYELAQHIVATGQDGYQRAVSQAVPQQQQREDPRIAQLQSQLAQVQEQTVTATVIEPFRASHPRYDELQGDIAFFLQSDKVPRSLSPSDRLAAAYDMAVRINPASHDDKAPADKTDPEPARRADESFSGSTSIKSAPGSVSPITESSRGVPTRDIIRREMKKAKVS